MSNLSQSAEKLEAQLAFNASDSNTKELNAFLNSQLSNLSSDIAFEDMQSAQLIADLANYVSNCEYDNALSVLEDLGAISKVRANTWRIFVGIRVAKFTE